MYPTEQLTALAWRKADLQAKIALHRAEFAEALERATQPLAKIDYWRARLRPLRFIWPVGAALMMARRKSSRRGGGRSWLRWLPVALQVARMAVRF